MKQKTVMVDPEAWQWLKEHRGAGNISDVIKSLIQEHEERKGTIPGKTENQELKDAVNTLQV
jgi:predicted CopG family antitoxin